MVLTLGLASLLLLRDGGDHLVDIFARQSLDVVL